MIETQSCRRGVILNAATFLMGLVLATFTGCQQNTNSPKPSIGPQRTVQVGLFDLSGGKSGDISKYRTLLSRELGFELTLIQADEIQQRQISHLDIVLFPGGKCEAQSNALGPEGRQAVREFVQSGGGYVGVCAGGFLACNDDDSKLGLLDVCCLSGAAEVAGWGEVDIQTRRAGVVKIELTEEAAKLLSIPTRSFNIDYIGGPVFLPQSATDRDACQPLGLYRSETWSYPCQRGTMVDTPAILYGQFGQGRVVAISPHPENQPETADMLRAIVTAVARCR